MPCLFPELPPDSPSLILSPPTILEPWAEGWAGDRGGQGMAFILSPFHGRLRGSEPRRRPLSAWPALRGHLLGFIPTHSSRQPPLARFPWILRPVMSGPGGKPPGQRQRHQGVHQGHECVSTTRKDASGLGNRVIR